MTAARHPFPRLLIVLAIAAATKAVAAGAHDSVRMTAATNLALR